MTAEMAEYYRIMLLVGFRDKLDQAFDQALEREDPLSDLILSLTTCISDDREVFHVLLGYTLDHGFDEQAVYDLVLSDITARYRSGELSRIQVVSLLDEIVHRLDKLWDEPWSNMTDLGYDLELWEDGLICEEVFNQCFDSWLFSGKPLNAWALQREFEQS